MNGSINSQSHHECEIAELRADKQLAVEYLKAALLSLHNPAERTAGLRALEAIVEAYGDLESLQEHAGLSDQALRHAVAALHA